MNRSSFEVIFWLIVGIFWVLAKLMKKNLPQEPEQEPKEFKIPREWEFPEEILLPQVRSSPQPEAQKPQKIEKEPETNKEEQQDLPDNSQVLTPFKTCLTAVRLPSFTKDKLQEGIILSIILGPPKALQR